MSDQTTCDIAGLLFQANLDASGGLPQAARNLRLAAAELWLRRRGKEPGLAFYCWVTSEASHDFRDVLPDAVWRKIQATRQGPVSHEKRFSDCGEAWAAAIAAVAQCLENEEVQP